MMNQMSMMMQQQGVGVPGGPGVVGGVGMAGPGGVGVPQGMSPQMQQAQQQQQVQQQQHVQQQQQQQVQQQQQQQHSQTAQQQAQQTEKVDNISKVKGLVGPLRDALSTTIKTAAQLIQQNNLTDAGSKTVDHNNATPRFDKHLEEFYSICDQIELNLKTAKLCMQQCSSSQQYLPIPVATSQQPPPDTSALTYNQYLEVVKLQIGYAKDIHDTLICAAQNISPSD